MRHPVGSPGDTADRLKPTGRQLQILKLVASGLSDKQIAARLGLSRSTIRTHLHRLYADHGLHNRAQAVALWMRGGGRSL
jgi:DNA-binding NarL/FixJ family response regulator